MTISNRKSVWDKLSKYCPGTTKDDFIEVTEWSNQDGWDITIGNRTLSLSMGELDAINYLTKVLYVEEA